MPYKAAFFLGALLTAGACDGPLALAPHDGGGRDGAPDTGPDADDEADPDSGTDSDTDSCGEPTLDCQGDRVISVDDCGTRIVRDCTESSAVCRGGQCCTPEVERRCEDGDVYSFDSCGNRELAQSCADTLDCTADSCANAQCAHQPDCSARECRETVESCHCALREKPALTCGTGTTIIFDQLTTSAYQDYASADTCNWEEDRLLDGDEIALVFNANGAADQFTYATVVFYRGSCGDENLLHPFALNGGTATCLTEECIGNQERDVRE